MSKGFVLMLVLVCQTVSCVTVTKPALFSGAVNENSWTAKASGIHCVIKGLTT